MSATPLPTHKTRTVIRSDTHKGKGFNELSFEDEADKQEIFIRAQNNMVVRGLNSKDERVEYNRTSSIGHDDELVIANDRKVTVEGNQDQKVTGNNLMLTEGDQGIQVKGDLTQKISGVFSVDSNGDLTLPAEPAILKAVAAQGTMFVAHCPAKEKKDE